MSKFFFGKNLVLATGTDKDSKYILIPEGITSKKVLIYFLSFSLDLETYAPNFDALYDGLATLLDNYPNKKIIIDHEKLPNIDDSELIKYLHVLDELSSSLTSSAENFTIAFQKHQGPLLLVNFRDENERIKIHRLFEEKKR